VRAVRRLQVGCKSAIQQSATLRYEQRPNDLFFSLLRRWGERVRKRRTVFFLVVPHPWLTFLQHRRPEGFIALVEDGGDDVIIEADSAGKLLIGGEVRFNLSPTLPRRRRRRKGAKPSKKSAPADRLPKPWSV
jgi:hypothetical protein